MLLEQTEQLRHDSTQRRARAIDHVLLNHLFHIRAILHRIYRARFAREPHKDIRNTARVFLIQRNDQINQVKPFRPIQYADQPEVNKCQCAGLRVNQNVAGMRVAVEKTIHHHLLEKRAHKTPSQIFAVHTRFIQRFRVCDFDPAHKLHGQNFARTEFRINAAHLHARLRFHVIAQAARVIRFIVIIQFAAHAIAKFLDDACQVHQARAFIHAFDGLRDLTQNAQIRVHHRDDIRTLHLDRNYRAIRQGRAMYLRGRRRRKRFALE